MDVTVLEMLTLQSGMRAERGVREVGVAVCRLFGPKLTKCMLINVCLIFRSMS